MDLSIVTTLYYSADYLEEFYSRISTTAQKITDDYEIILVNDGSPDNSLDIAISLFEKDKKVKVIDLSRNFDHHKAVMTGLAHTTGSLVFSIACDLEEEPELLGAFYEEMRKDSETDVIYGIQEKRKGGFFERLSGSLFYTFFNLLSSETIPHNLVSSRLMSRRYVLSLVKHKEREVFLGGLQTITGFKQVPLIVKKGSKGNSTYTFRRKISLFVNAVTAFTNKPLVYIFYLGSVILLLSGSAGFYLIIKKILFGGYLLGWASMLVSIWFLGGLTTFCVGILGIYLSKIFIETKRRPYTIVRQIYGETVHEQQSLVLHRKECHGA